jgi:hypothetical protein
VIWTGPGLVALGLITTMMDAFSVWIIDRSTEDFAASFTAMLGMAGEEDETTAVLGNPLSIIGIALIAWFVSGLQEILLTIRGAVIGIIAGVLPTMAAASSTGLGRPAYERVRNWMIAWVLYKPTAAIIYANGFMSAQDNTGEPLANAWRTIALMGLGLAAMPALIKVINPLAASVSGGSSGAGAAATTATATGMAQLRGGSTGAAGAAGAAGPTGMAVTTAAKAGAATARQGVGSSPPPPPPPPASNQPPSPRQPTPTR